MCWASTGGVRVAGGGVRVRVGDGGVDARTPSDLEASMAPAAHDRRNQCPTRDTLCNIDDRARRGHEDGTQLHNPTLHAWRTTPCAEWHPQRRGPVCRCAAAPPAPLTPRFHETHAAHNSPSLGPCHEVSGGAAPRGRIRADGSGLSPGCVGRLLKRCREYARRIVRSCAFIARAQVCAFIA